MNDAYRPSILPLRLRNGGCLMRFGAECLALPLMAKVRMPDNGVMSNDAASLIETVLAFYAAENARDWSSYEALVDPDIVYEEYPSGECGRGRDGFIAGVQEMYKGRDATMFTVRSIGADASRGVVHAELECEGRLSVNVFELRDGRIVAEREYLARAIRVKAGISTSCPWLRVPDRGFPRRSRWRGRCRRAGCRGWSPCPSPARRGARGAGPGIR